MSKADEKQKGVRAPGPALKSTGKARSGGPVVPEVPPEPVEIPKDAYVVSLPSFEGPLDLLLQIIQKHELDILDIPISFITEKYLAYLTVMQSLSIDVASEYLVMAATLAHIKSKMLLPELPSGQDDDAAEEELDPREELVRRLLEYQKYKAAAEDLGGRDALGRDVFVRGTTEDVPDGPAPFAKLGVFELLDAFSKLMGRSKVKIEHEVVFDRISISDRINELCDVLRNKRSLPFEALFPDEPTRFDLIITFLALLEMCRLKMLNVFQVESLSPIHLELLVVDEDDDEPLALRSQPPPKRESDDDTSHGAEAVDDASVPGDDVDVAGATDDAPEADDELLEASETELTSEAADVVEGMLEAVRQAEQPSDEAETGSPPGDEAFESDAGIAEPESAVAEAAAEVDMETEIAAGAEAEAAEVDVETETAHAEGADAEAVPMDADVETETAHAEGADAEAVPMDADVDGEPNDENGVADARSDAEPSSAIDDEPASFDTDPTSRLAIDASDTEVSSVVEPITEAPELPIEPLEDAHPEPKDDDLFAGSLEALNEVALSALPPVESSDDSGSDDSGSDDSGSDDSGSDDSGSDDSASDDSASDDSASDDSASDDSASDDSASACASKGASNDAASDALEAPSSEEGTMDAAPPSDDDGTARKLHARDGDDAAGPDGSMSMNETADPASHDERAE